MLVSGSHFLIASSMFPCHLHFYLSLSASSYPLEFQCLKSLQSLFQQYNPHQTWPHFFPTHLHGPVSWKSCLYLAACHVPFPYIPHLPCPTFCYQHILEDLLRVIEITWLPFGRNICRSQLAWPSLHLFMLLLPSLKFGFLCFYDAISPGSMPTCLVLCSVSSPHTLPTPKLCFPYSLWVWLHSRLTSLAPYPFSCVPSTAGVTSTYTPLTPKLLTPI